MVSRRGPPGGGKGGPQPRHRGGPGDRDDGPYRCAGASSRAGRAGRRAGCGGARLLHGNLGAQEGGPPPGFARLVAQVGRTRGFGDFYQHMLVAEGAGEIAVDPVMHPWDIAALQVIVEEAGGRATSLTGERSIHATSLVTSNGVLHEAALAALDHP